MIQIADTLHLWTTDEGEPVEYISEGEKRLAIEAVITSIRTVARVGDRVLEVKEMYRTGGLLVIRGHGIAFMEDSGKAWNLSHEEMLRVVNNYLLPLRKIDNHTRATVEAEALIFNDTVMLRKISHNTWKET